MRRAAEEERVHRPPVTSRSRIGIPLFRRLRERVHTVALRRPDAWSADRAIQEAGGRNSRIANDFSFPVHSLLPSQEQVARVFVLQVESKIRRLTIGAASHDQPMHFL